jgi:hypothetical protein
MYSYCYVLHISLYKVMNIFRILEYTKDVIYIYIYNCIHIYIYISLAQVFLVNKCMSILNVVMFIHCFLCYLLSRY